MRIFLPPTGSSSGDSLMRHFIVALQSIGGARHPLPLRTVRINRSPTVPRRRLLCWPFPVPCCLFCAWRPSAVRRRRKKCCRSFPTKSCWTGMVGQAGPQHPPST